MSAGHFLFLGRRMLIIADMLVFVIGTISTVVATSFSGNWIISFLVHVFQNCNFLFPTYSSVLGTTDYRYETLAKTRRTNIPFNHRLWSRSCIPYCPNVRISQQYSSIDKYRSRPNFCMRSSNASAVSQCIHCVPMHPLCPNASVVSQSIHRFPIYPPCPVISVMSHVHTYNVIPLRLCFRYMSGSFYSSRCFFPIVIFLEMSPPNVRGSYGVLHQLFITIGRSSTSKKNAELLNVKWIRRFHWSSAWTST